MDRRFVFISLFLAFAPLVNAWILPYQVSYHAAPGDAVKLCATVLSDSNAPVTLTCGNRVVGEANVIAGAPAVLCYTYPVSSSTSCLWSDGVDSERVYVHADYSPVVDAFLALLLIVLVVRFTVKLVRIYM